MQEWLTVKQIHEAYPRIGVKLAQTVAREELADKGLARKIGSKRRGTWLIEPSVIPNLLSRAGRHGRKPRRPTEGEKVTLDRTYRLNSSVASIARRFSIRWTRAKAWLIEVYGPDTKEWPEYQYPLPDID